MYSKLLTEKYDEIKSRLPTSQIQDVEEKITIQSVAKGCIEIKLVALPSIFNDTDELRNSIQSFLQKVIDASGVTPQEEQTINITWLFRDNPSECMYKYISFFLNMGLHS